MIADSDAKPTKIVPVNKNPFLLWIEMWWSSIFVNHQEFWWAILFISLIVSTWAIVPYLPFLMPDNFPVRTNQTIKRQYKGQDGIQYELLIEHPSKLAIDRSFELRFVYDPVTAPSKNSDTSQVYSKTPIQFHDADTAKVDSIDSLRVQRLDSLRAHISDSAKTNRAEGTKLHNLYTVTVHIKSKPKFEFSPSKLSFEAHDEHSRGWPSSKFKIPNFELPQIPKKAVFYFTVISDKQSDLYELELPFVTWPQYVLQLVTFLSSAGILGIKSVAPLLVKVGRFLLEKIISNKK